MKEEIGKAKLMGEVLVTKTRTGKQWYATTTPSPSPLITHSNFAKKPKKLEQTPTSSFLLEIIKLRA
ncbi:MAG: hypothetical protein LCH30_01200 [Proteobacteria bacterium]|nr:hypothetical protein [Pseudomonadota bacterium]